MAFKTREERSVICISSIHLHLTILFQVLACTGIISGAQVKRLSRSFNSGASCISRTPAETSGYSFLRDKPGYAEFRDNQAFSTAGRRKGFEDARGTLFFELARVVKEKRPLYLFLEFFV